MSYMIWVYHVYHWDPFSSSPIGKPLRDDVVLWKADLVLYLKARAGQIRLLIWWWPVIICHRQSDQPVFVLHSWEYLFTNLLMGIFISYPLICRYVGDGVGFLLFEALRSHYCGSPICSTLIVPVPTLGRIACMNPRLWGGLLKWWIPKSLWLFQHWNDLVLDHLGVTPYWWIVDCARGKALQFLPKRVRRELLEGPTAQKKWEVSAEHSKRIWCWSVWNGSAECDSPPPPKNGGITS